MAQRNHTPHMNILVTGGAGFIGNEITLRLIKDGCDVVVVDNVNEYYDPSLKEDRLKRLPESVVVCRVDIADREALEAVFKEHGPFDAIQHVAAQAGVRYSIENPYTYADSNFVGTQNILELAKENGKPHIVYASSSSVYGMRDEVPFREDMRVDEPISVYAATKRATELLAYTYTHLHDMHITVLRPFTVYGPWSRPDMALLLFAHAITEDKPIRLFNGGDMLRDFTYIDDIVDGFVKALNAPKGYKIYNIGRGAPTPLKKFVSVLEDALGKKAKVQIEPMQPGDVKQTYADISAARADFGYDPKVSVEEGVEKFARWFREYYT